MQNHPKGLWKRSQDNLFLMHIEYMNTISVAVVEDVEEIRNALQILINGSKGFSCESVFSNAEDALQHLPQLKPDVVLMDINLPGKNGIECVKTLANKIPATQFMMCTVYEDDDNIFEALSAGASGYLLKRSPPVQILQAIQELYEGGSPMSSEIARRVVESLKKKGKPSDATDILTEREKEILDFLSKGYLYKEIANELFISKETVKRHIHNIYEKLQVETRIEALNKAFPR